jgi:hypothetical protein
VTATLELRSQQDTYLDGILDGKRAYKGHFDILLKARNVWASQAVGFEKALNMANFASGASGPRTHAQIGKAHREILWASGVREGYKIATADRSDAHECPMCDERVLTRWDEDAVQCEDHGWFCNVACRADFCRPTCAWPEDVAP